LAGVVLTCFPVYAAPFSRPFSGQAPYQTQRDNRYRNDDADIRQPEFRLGSCTNPVFDICRIEAIVALATPDSVLGAVQEQLAVSTIYRRLEHNRTLFRALTAGRIRRLAPEGLWLALQSCLAAAQIQLIVLAYRIAGNDLI
jgi:hypothetical protein